MTIHLVYVKGNSISTPYSITYELAQRLSQQAEVCVYDWTEARTISPQPGDILIGHPHPYQNAVFVNSFWQPGWHKRIILMPFHHAMLKYIAWLDPLVEAADVFLAITGKYWIETMAGTLVSHWEPKIIHLDLAVNLNNFPRIKYQFNPPGKRRFLYIGHTLDYKGFDYLEQLAICNPNLAIGWIGGGRCRTNHITVHGILDFTQAASLELVSHYDFLLTCGRSDANPTTILEAAAWGLIPICTPQSGYYHEDWLINIPLDQPEAALKILNQLNYLSHAELLHYQATAHVVLQHHYHWDRFAQQVIDCLTHEVPVFPTDGNWQMRAKKNRQALRWIARLTRWKTAIFQHIYQPVRYLISRILRPLNL